MSSFALGESSCVNPDVPTISANNNPACNGNSTLLSVTSGSLNSAIAWQWYSGSCGGTSEGSGTSINASPSGITTYYVRGEGGCVTPGWCAEITITVNPTYATSFDATACDIYDLPWGGSVTESGPYQHVYTSVAGCDSLVTANVTIHYSSTPTSFYATACDNYDLPWDGSVNISGSYMHTYENAAGCDSVVTANITISYSSTPTSFYTTACDSYDLPWSESVTTSGAYDHTYTNSAGCDSIVTVNVTVKYSSNPTSFDATACDSYELPWGGSVSSSGSYMHTYGNAAGCDSVVTANVTINNPALLLHLKQRLVTVMIFLGVDQ
jgi:hypothetical protein